MFNDNIPDGYDGNGVRNGNGAWDDDEEREVEVDIDQFEEPSPEDFVKCNECGKIITREEATTTFSGTGYLCEDCKEEFEY